MLGLKEISKLEIAKAVIKKYYSSGCCGLFNTRNIVGDSMETIYDRDGLTIDICYYWSYFEVFGLTENEFRELHTYYDILR